ncbi:MAG: hypothetical protein QOJ11_2551 [Frankiales bacterium]|jgi:hypothetical protein|nr:hypothetical protein [Frankiales bacterium]
MIFIGLLLLIIGVVALVDTGVSSSGTADIHVLGWHLGTLGTGRVLLLGAAAGAVIALGLFSVLSGQLRSRRRRRDRDRTIARTRDENKRLAAQLEEEQKRRAETVQETAPERSPRVVSTGDVDAYPSETGRGGADYVLGGKYPRESSAASTPPAPPANNS